MFKEGLFCNCKGEGTDLLVIGEINEDSCSVTSFSCINLKDFDSVKSKWHTALFWWEDLNKIHFDFIPETLKNKGLFDLFDEDLIKDPTPPKYKREPLGFLPDDMELLSHAANTVNWPKDDINYNSIPILAAYLSFEILGVSLKASKHFGSLLAYLIEVNFETIVRHETSTEEIVENFLINIPVCNGAKEYFTEAFFKLSDYCCINTLVMNHGITAEYNKKFIDRVSNKRKEIQNLHLQ